MTLGFQITIAVAEQLSGLETDDCELEINVIYSTFYNYIGLDVRVNK